VGRADSKAIYADGFLLFVRNETLFSQPFDTARLMATGDPVVVAQNIPTNPRVGTAAFSASAMGDVSYRAFSSSRLLTQLTWLDRHGKIIGTVGEPVDQTAMDLSRDGSQVAISVLDPARRTRDIWIHDLKRDLRTRFTFEPGEDWASAWSPDGRSLVFSTSRTGPLDVYQKAADGSGAEERLVEGGGHKYVSSWSGDGRFVLYYTGAAGLRADADLWVLPMSGDRKPRPLLQTTFRETDGEFSPDGRWVAYVSNESGSDEIYVMPFASPGGKWQVSTTSGSTSSTRPPPAQPKWRGDSKELFYLAGDIMMAAEVNGAGPAFQVRAIRRLFEVPRRTASYLGFNTGNVYDVTADGQRFLVNVVAEEQVASPPPITVITNWTATLR
jgi:Tol biopolymer transport system component